MPEPVGLGATGELGWRMANCWTGMGKSWARLLESAAAKKTSKTSLASLKLAGGFFLSNYFFSFNTFASLLSRSIPSFFPFISLLPSFFLFFFFF